MESQPQIPEFRNNRENFHPCLSSFPIIWLKKRGLFGLHLKKPTGQKLHYLPYGQ